MARPSDTSNGLDTAGAAADARRWAEWLCFDLEHFVTPLVAATGMTRTEVLLYMMSERLSQLVDYGVTLHVEHHHHYGDDDEEQLPGEEWKKP